MKINDRLAEAAFGAFFFGLLMCAVTQSGFSQGVKAPAGQVMTMNGYSLGQFPDFEKKWHLVTSRFRKDTGEMRLTYANDLAWKALQAKSADYPDGAVFAKIGMMTEEDPDFTSSAVPSGAKRYQLMVRNHKKHPETHGWGYAIFTPTGQATFKPEDQRIESLACNACHEMVPQRGYVFSQPMVLAVGQVSPHAVASEPSQISFTSVDTATLRDDVKKLVPAVFKQVRRVHGPFEKHVFVGTMGEIRHVLIKEAIRTNHPAALISDDTAMFSLTYIDTDKPACDAHGKKGASIISIFTTGPTDSKSPPTTRNEYCEALP